MKKPATNPVDQIEVDQEAAQLLGDAEANAENRRKDEETKALQNLFGKCKFFIGREVPREMFAFAIRACGGDVSWDKTICAGSTYDVSDETITHQLIDRPILTDMIVNRVYVQPQWVFDSINARKLLPVDGYLPGSILPPHLSPFVEEKEGDYVPPERLGQRQPDIDVDEETTKEIPSINLVENSAYLNGGQKRKRIETNETTVAKSTTKEERKRAMRVESGQIESVNVSNIIKRKADEELRLREMTIPKKQKRLYDKIKFSQKKKRQEVEKLKRKRVQHDQSMNSETNKKKQLKLS
jgi:pescadillo protein